MSSQIKKKEERTESNLLAQFNQQNNILVENELNAIERLYKTSPELANRAMRKWEESVDHRNVCDKEIITIEKKEQEMREKDMKLYYRWSGFGIVASFVFPLIVFCSGVWLTIKGYPMQGLGAMGFSFVIASPKIYREFKQSSKKQK